jgi:peptidoglycan hydrolase-like protein with peptidoglycan-binding domain
MTDEQRPPAAEAQELPHYRLIQKGVNANIPASDLESLVTHHPGANRNAVFRDGVPTGVENPDRRSYGMVGGELQELETQRTDGGARSVLGEHQVLLIKDFMLEDSRIQSGGAGVRDVDVPSPVAGYVGRRIDGQGLVEIYDRQGGEVIARMRHLSGISVNVGDTVEYGQALGTQDRIGLPATAGKHVHLEMDTRYYQQYENYMQDLSDGRLAIDPARRGAGIEARAVIDDGIVRIGESSDRVRDLQRVLAEENHRGLDGQPVAQDGVYRLSMQPAVLNFQRDHGIPQTGDIDGATLQLAPPLPRPERDHQDHNDLRDGLGAHALERLSPQERDVHDRAFAAVQAHGGFSEEQSRNIAAAGLLAFKETRSVQEAQDVGVYGDRLRISSFPYGRERETSFNADVNLADAAQKPMQHSLQQVETLGRQQVIAMQQVIDPSQQPIASAPGIGARGA